MIYLTQIQSQPAFCYGRDIRRIRRTPLSGLPPLPVSVEEYEAEFERQDSLLRRYDPDAPIRRSRNKELTLRSWRNPRAIGGTNSRKATAHMLQLRSAMSQLRITVRNERQV